MQACLAPKVSQYKSWFFFFTILFLKSWTDTFRWLVAQLKQRSALWNMESAHLMIKSVMCLSNSRTCSNNLIQIRIVSYAIDFSEWLYLWCVCQISERAQIDSLIVFYCTSHSTVFCWQNAHLCLRKWTYNHSLRYAHVLRLFLCLLCSLVRSFLGWLQESVLTTTAISNDISQRSNLTKSCPD